MQTYNIYEHNEIQDGKIEDLQARVRAIEESLRISKSTDELPLALKWENLRLLPNDICEAVEQCKLAIIRHRADNWYQVPRDTMSLILESLATMAKQQPIDHKGEL